MTKRKNGGETYKGPLTAKKIAKLKVGRYLDGGPLGRGLYVQISPRKLNGEIIEPPEIGGGSWLLRYERDGRERWMGLGSLAVFTLKEARERARAARQLLADGIDPLERKQAARQEKALAAAKTTSFESAARQYFEEHQRQWKNAKHRGQFLSTLETYAFPIIGKLPIGSIDKVLVLKVLEQKHADYPDQRLWDAIPETASRLRGRIELILGWDAVRSDRSNAANPARWRDHLEHVLPARGKVKHHAALSYNKIGEFFADLRRCDGTAAAALEFTILTAARSGEVLGARWQEIELRAVPVTTRDDESGQESTCIGPCVASAGSQKYGNHPRNDRSREDRVSRFPVLILSLPFFAPSFIPACAGIGVDYLPLASARPSSFKARINDGRSGLIRLLECTLGKPNGGCHEQESDKCEGQCEGC